MPELPEVETIARRLAQVLPGKHILSVEPHVAKSFVGLPDKVIGSTITGITRKAKLLTISLDTDTVLLVHLKMTGQLIYVDEAHRLGGGHPTADWTATLPSAHTRVTLRLSGAAHLFFNDQRIFGWIKVLPKTKVSEEFKNTAPDIIDPQITPEYFYEKTKTRGIPIKQLLMDNTFVAGVGNIYANDALHLAGIAPNRPARSLSQAEAAKLYTAAKTVIELGITLGGATIDHFRHIDGFSGEYQKEVRVYGKESIPCQVCGTPILKIVLGGRGTFYCPQCQR